jgi:colanic acid biosynthesis glycosyl transferase WcaI
MELVLHDFSGHPFQAELARKLAADGHTVRHVSALQYIGGKGHLTVLPEDSQTLRFDGIEVKLPFQKYAPFGRVRWEIAYGQAWLKYAQAHAADAVIMCNVPLIAMAFFVLWAKLRRRPWVFWHQDIYSSAMATEIHGRLPRPLATLGARFVVALEAFYARSASQVVAIGDAFTEEYPNWGVDPARVSVIPNWAPLDRIVPVDRDNRRTADVFPDPTGLRLLYAGTLGRKHNPLLLVDLMRDLHEAQVPAQLTVVSEGEGADELAETAAAHPDVEVRLLPFQPAEDLSLILGSADVLLSLLEPDATRFSIPSKVLSYLAAGRPVAGLMPSDNPAAQDIATTGGIVAAPSVEGAREVALWLALLDPEQVVKIGQAARALAEEKFDLDTIAARFTDVLRRAVAS